MKAKQTTKKKTTDENKNPNQNAKPIHLKKKKIQ